MNIDEITKYIFIEDEKPAGDVALVFGTGASFMLAVEKAAKLYHDNLIPKIILSGGLNKHENFIEAHAMADELKKLGIPDEDIIIEDKSSNTLENVLFSKDAIQEKIGLENIKTIVAVVKNYHSRRCLMTLRKHFPERIKLQSAVYESLRVPSRENWNDAEVSRLKVFEELEKIKKYLEKGDIAEI